MKLHIIRCFSPCKGFFLMKTVLYFVLILKQRTNCERILGWKISCISFEARLMNTEFCAKIAVDQYVSTNRKLALAIFK